MYGAPNVAVDKGLGFDFSAISDFVKTAATTGLNIYQQQMQLKQVKAMQVPVNYGPSQYVNLPVSQALAPIQPTFGTSMPIPQQAGIGIGAMLTIGALVVGGLVLVMRK